MNMFSTNTEIIRNKILMLSQQIRDAIEARDRLLPKLLNEGNVVVTNEKLIK